MKIILSRKGFDSSLGKVPSPIFPSGELCSLPIPESMPDSCSARYEEIKVGERSLGTIVNELTQGKIKGDARAHLDPDLNSGSITRQENRNIQKRSIGCAAFSGGKTKKLNNSCN